MMLSERNQPSFHTPFIRSNAALPFEVFGADRDGPFAHVEDLLAQVELPLGGPPEDDRGSDEDGGVGADHHADEHGEGEIRHRLAAEDIHRKNRQGGDPAGDNGAA